MNVYTTTKFKGHYPIGSAAVITATSKEHAVELLEAELTRIGLAQKITVDQIEELDVAMPKAVVLVDGNY